MLEKVKEMCPGMPVVLITAYGSVANAVAAMKSSADIVRVITLMTRELEEVGLDFAIFGI